MDFLWGVLNGSFWCIIGSIKPEKDREGEWISKECYVGLRVFLFW